MTKYKNVKLEEGLHTKLKIQAAFNKRTLIEELEEIIKGELEGK